MNPYLIIGSLLGSLLLGAAGGAWINGNAWEARYNGLVAEHAQAVTDAAIQSAVKRLQLIQDMKGVNDALDIEKAKNDKFAACVADGSCVVRVKARCPSVPAANPAASGVIGPAPELDPAARSDYFALRRELDEQFAVLTACYKYAARVMQP